MTRQIAPATETTVPRETRQTREERHTVRRKANRKERIASMLEGGPRIGPETVHFDIANNCNTRCTTCWHHSPHLQAQFVPSAAWKRQRLTFAAFKPMLDDLLALGGLENIILSGMGDPTLNPELYAMVEYAHGADIAVTIITNLLKADLPRLLASDGELDLLTSICGVTQPVWQAFHAHPSPRGFERLVEQLETLAEVGFRPKHVQVINTDNVHELPEMIRFASRFPVKRVNFKLASLARGTQAVALSSEQQQRLVDTWIPQAQAEASRLEITTDLPAFATQVVPGSTRTAPIEETGCFMGYLYGRVTVEGELLYCCNTNVSVGQVTAETPLSEMWDGPRYASLRQHLRAGRYFKGCDQCGKYKQNLKWAARLRDKLPPDVFAGLIGAAPSSPSGDLG